MNKTLKILLPPFVAFAIFFLAIRYSTLYFTLKIDEIGEGNLSGFMAYYKYTLPLLFCVALLTQLLIVLPVWRQLYGTHAALKVAVGLDMGIICLLFASGIGYIIWDKNEGTLHLIKLITFMTSVQIVYWTINLSALYLLE